MQKIKIFRKNIEVKVSVTDEMAADLRDCARKAEGKDPEKCKDCSTCSWDQVAIGSAYMCTIQEVIDRVLGITEGKK